MKELLDDGINVYKIDTFKTETESGITLYWENENNEFGTYDLVLSDNTYNEEIDNFQQKIIGFSECMDNNDDKSFLRLLLSSLIKHVEVVE